jgi:hypothetical protein
MKESGQRLSETAWASKPGQMALSMRVSGEVTRLMAMDD